MRGESRSRVLGSKTRNEIGARFVRTRGEMFGRSGGRKKPMNN